MSPLKESPARRTLAEPGEIAGDWLRRLETALESGAVSPDLFTADTQWKDAVAFTLDVQTTTGGERVAAEMTRLQGWAEAAGFTVASEPPAQVKSRAGREVVEAFFDFRTRLGVGRGVVRIPVGEDGDGDRAWSLLTTLQSLDGYPEPDGRNRPRGGIHANSFGEPNWAARRGTEVERAGVDPDVLIVGGGQAGMILAARLRRLGVHSLVIDKNERAGDNWRKRYDSLALHNEAWVCELPFMPFPPNWPVYVPKDMLADWFETYAWAMEINYWTSTELVTASYDPARRRWSATLLRDGREEIVNADHLVLATGLSGEPRIPALPGIDSFRGTVLHTSQYTTGRDWAGKRAIVVGTGNSGHDVAQDLHAHGARAVTMVQRAPTTVTSVEPAAQLVFALYSEGPATEDCDLLSASMTEELMVRGQKILARKMYELDKPLLDRLDEAGFRTDIGDDDSGYYMKYLRTGGGYYLNVGCSELIAGGEIGVVQASEVTAYGPEGLQLADGRTIEADLIVLATGYDNLQQTTRRLLGDDVAEKVGPVWGYDERGDLQNVWKRTAQEHLWYMAGSLGQCRTYSRFVALQIKADLDGVIPPEQVTSASGRESVTNR